MLQQAGQRSANPGMFITVESAAQVETPNRMLAIVGPIMAGMMIFYAFYTGMTTAETILREDEEGTLPRLFTTPTSRTAILAGKFLAVGMTVFVQVVVLIIAARLIFQVEWGNPLYVTLIALGTVLAASAFGVFANSLIKSTKQGGAIYGGVLTVTGMLGMIKIFTLGVPNRSPMLEIVSLLVPQGWAVRGMLLSSAAAPTDGHSDYLCHPDGLDHCFLQHRCVAISSPVCMSFPGYLTGELATEFLEKEATMKSIIDITIKDLTQLVRNRMTFLFLLIMPIAFTLLFGYAFGGFGNDTSEPRFPVGYLDLDQSGSSFQLKEIFSRSPVIYLEETRNVPNPSLSRWSQRMI